jgi:hypothetical protein
MNPRELVDHIRSGPAEVVFDEPLRFRRRTRSNPCDFNEFLQALRSSETIRTATCFPNRIIGITEDEWVLLVKALGSIKGIVGLSFVCKSGSRDFHPFQAVADAVNNARSLFELDVRIHGETFPRDSSGLAALANALREHMALEEFAWYDYISPLLEAAQSTALDPLLRALPACRHLPFVYIMTKCASADAMENLLQLRPATKLHLYLETEHWLAVANGIREGRCNIKQLYLELPLISNSKATEAVKALASAIQMDCNLEHLGLETENGFRVTDPALISRWRLGFLAKAPLSTANVCQKNSSIPHMSEGKLKPRNGGVEDA